MLLDNGIAVAGALDLAFGVSLTAEQIASLDRDIVWYVTARIDGQDVLVPQLYLSANGRAQAVAGAAAMSGQRDVAMSAANIVNMNGAIMARQDLSLTAVESIYGIGGRLVWRTGRGWMRRMRRR